MTATEQNPPGEQFAEFIQRARLFRNLDDRARTAVADALEPLKVNAGAIVFPAGAPGDAMFFITSGEVRIVAGNGSEAVVLADLGPGQFFGEMALALGMPRTADAVATTDVDLLKLPADAFHSLADRFPALRSAVARVSEHRLDSSSLFENEAFELLSLADANERVSIGSGAHNTIQLDLPGVADRHADIVQTPAGHRLIHMGGHAGTFCNQRQVMEHDLEEGDLIQLGSARLFLHDGKLKLYQHERGIRLDLAGLGRQIKNGKQLLQGIDLVVYPGELVAIVGPSGAGKSTLMKLMLGLDTPTAGKVMYDGHDLGEVGDAYRQQVGYVPQGDIVHPELTARESLEYAGRLRIGGIGREHLEQRMTKALAQVHLENAADTRLAVVSGGQRKRACVAVELMTDPKLLFLDEPTSGLDPGLDEQLMLNFRELADAGRTVVLTTHATRNIAVCDLVVILKAGRLVFAGSPLEALSYFEVDEFAEIYHQVETNSAEGLAGRYEASTERSRWVGWRSESESPGRPAPSRGHGPLGRAVDSVRQMGVLLRRDASIALRDRINLGLRLIGPPALAISMLITFNRHIFAGAVSDGGNAREAVTLLYMMSIINLFLSTITASVAITRENAIFRREQLVNLSPVAYVVSKFGVLAVFAVLQAAMILGTLAIGIEFPHPLNETLPRVFGALALTSLAGMALGLLVSSVSPNADRAVIIAVLVIIPQLIFGGSTVPREVMQAPARSISDSTVTKWSLELLGNVTSMGERIAGQAKLEVPVAGQEKPVTVQTTTPFDHAFDVSAPSRWAVLVGFVLLFTLGTVAVQELKPRLPFLRE